MFVSLSGVLPFITITLCAQVFCGLEGDAKHFGPGVFLSEPISDLEQVKVHTRDAIGLSFVVLLEPSSLYQKHRLHELLLPDCRCLRIFLEFQSTREGSALFSHWLNLAPRRGPSAASRKNAGEVAVEIFRACFLSFVAR